MHDTLLSILQDINQLPVFCIRIDIESLDSTAAHYRFAKPHKYAAIRGGYQAVTVLLGTITSWLGLNCYYLV